MFARIRRRTARWFADDFHRYRAAAVAVTVVGIALSAMAFLAVSRQERLAVEHEFEEHARGNLSAIKLAVGLGFADVESAGALFDLGGEISRAQFRAFGQRLLRRAPTLKAIAWAPLVPDARREAFEARARLDVPGYAINERDAKFQVVPARRRPEYFPILYSEDKDGASPFGFDTAAAPGRRQLLMQSRGSGQAEVSGRIRIQTGQFSGQFGVSMVRPVYRYGESVGTEAQREHHHAGFATSIFVVWGMIDSALVRVGSDSMRVVIYDDSAPPGERFLAVWPEKVQEDPARTDAADERAGLQFRETIDVGSRKWTVVMTPVAGGFGAGLSWGPWGVLVVGLLFSLLLAVLLESARRHAQNMREQAITDPLTGLYNRRYLWEFLKLEFSRARRKRTILSAILLDIDYFKRINDTHGHEAGDLVLASLGALLKRSIRGSDVACRYGGEEFVLLLPETAVEFAERKAEAIRLAVKGLDLSGAVPNLGRVSVSLGVASFPVHAGDADTLLGCADTALYEAKQGGRDRVVVCRTPAAGPASGLLSSGTGSAGPAVAAT